MDEHRRPPRYVLPGPNPGLLVRGNIDINNRPQVKNPRGGISTVYTTSFSLEDWNPPAEVLLPQVVKLGGSWRIVSATQAWQFYVRTKQHLGIFDTVAHANAYSNRLHRQQAKLYLGATG